MGWRNTRQSLQDIADIKEQEQKEKERQKKDAEEFEQLKKDITEATDSEFLEIEKDGNNLLLYFYNNKLDVVLSVYDRLLDSHRIIVKDKEAERHFQLKPPFEGYYKDDSGHLKPRYYEISKYNENDYKKEKMLVLIEQIITEQLGAEQKDAKIIEQIEQKEQKKSNEDLKSKILNYMIIAYKEQKEEKENLTAFDFYDLSNTERVRAIYFEALGIDETIETIGAYSEALKNFKKYYCLGIRPKEQKQTQKAKGLGFLGTALAVFLGICEGIEKGK